MKVTYSKLTGGTSQTSTSRVDLINKTFEIKFAGKPDKDMIDFLATVHGPYKDITELSITTWSEERLNALVEALAKL